MTILATVRSIWTSDPEQTMNLAACWRRFLPAMLCALFCAAGGSQIVAVEMQNSFPDAEWIPVTPESQGMSPAEMERVGEWLADHGSKAGLVVRHGQIVGEWYFEGTSERTKHDVYSSAKSFTSTAAGLAIAAGKLR